MENINSKISIKNLYFDYIDKKSRFGALEDVNLDIKVDGTDSSYPTTPYATYEDKSTYRCKITGLSAGKEYNFKVESYYSGKSNMVKNSKLTNSK